MATEMCRAMARKGFAVDIIGDAGSPAARSRFCSRHFVTGQDDSWQPFLEVVRQAVSAVRYDAIFVCNEEVLEAILSTAGSEDWPGLVISSRPTLKTALSKSAMTSLAESAGIAAPKTFQPSDEVELPLIAAELGFPLIVKGERGEAGNHVRLVERPAQLVDAYHEIASLEIDDGYRPLVQEYIAGVPYSVGGLFHQGRPLRVCAHRKLVAVPPLGGLTVRGVTERPGGLLEQAFGIFDTLDYTGLGHVELIRDAEGCFRFLEVNPRAWGTIGVAEYAAVDFFTPYTSLARGEVPEPNLHFREGVRFHRIGREAKMIWRKPSRVFGFLRDSLDPRVRSDFEWLDPAPHLLAFAGRGTRSRDPIRVERNASTVGRL
jgi:hypothetical protein